MTHFWRTVSIALGALLATGCFGTPKYGVADSEDTGDTAEDAVPVAAAADQVLPREAPLEAVPVEPIAE